MYRYNIKYHHTYKDEDNVGLLKKVSCCCCKANHGVSYITPMAVAVGMLATRNWCLTNALPCTQKNAAEMHSMQVGMVFVAA